MDLVLPEIYRIHTNLNDVQHDLCVALVYNEESRGSAFVVADPAGHVIAWDGWYFDPKDDELHTSILAGALTDAEWADWDDMPSKLLVQTVSQWADKQMAFWLMPTFSVARAAASLAALRAGDSTSEKAGNRLLGGRVIAYLPVVDRDVYERVLAEERGRRGR